MFEVIVENDPEVEMIDIGANASSYYCEDASQDIVDVEAYYVSADKVNEALPEETNSEGLLYESTIATSENVYEAVCWIGDSLGIDPDDIMDFYEDTYGCELVNPIPGQVVVIRVITLK